MHQNRKKQTDRSKVFDKYYTKKHVVLACLKKVQELSRSYDFVIEPSAGGGAFYKELDHPGKIGMDLEPADKQIIQQDWLKYKISREYKSVLVIGNPPFGQYHKTSSAFIIHALSHQNVQTIAFILPNVYRKHTRQRILPADWRIVSITGLGKNSFEIDGRDYHIPSSFFVFDKSQGKDLRANSGQYKNTRDFAFGNKNNFDIFVFGASPKRITRNPKPNNRGHYIKSKIPVEDLIENIKKIEWIGNSCANGGVYWLSQNEFLEQYIKRYEPDRDTESSTFCLR